MSRPSHTDSQGSPAHMAKTGITTNFGKPHNGWRRRLYIILFEADTPAGRWFDFTLIGAILISVLAVVVEGAAYGFTGIPTSVYVAFTAITTVGYGAFAERFSSKRGRVGSLGPGYVDASRQFGLA